jgi:cell wall-associated NlpC family hydrolase
VTPKHRRRAALTLAASAVIAACAVAPLDNSSAGGPASPARATEAHSNTRPVAAGRSAIAVVAAVKARPHTKRTTHRHRSEHRHRHRSERGHRVARAARAAETGTDRIVHEMVEAGDRIATLPYVWGGGHGYYVGTGAETEIEAGYDCSGSVSFVLHAAGLLSVPEDSSELESYGEPGPGRLVTIYADAEHAFMVIGRRRFDTISLQETGNRWSDEIGSTAGYVAVHPAGL